MSPVPRVIGLVSRALLAATVLAAAALVARLYAHGLLSRAQLGTAVADVTDWVKATAPAFARSRRTLAGVTFVLGLATGWALALWWSSSRLRRRPLIVADLRSADMPLADGIRHVRRHAFPPVDNDAAAMVLILAEAGRGRLALWRRSRANTLRRVSRRAIRATAVALAEGGGLETRPESWNAVTWPPLMLLGAEVERVWPCGHANRSLVR